MGTHSLVLASVGLLGEKMEGRGRTSWPKLEGIIMSLPPVPDLLVWYVGTLLLQLHSQCQQWQQRVLATAKI